MTIDIVPLCVCCGQPAHLHHHREGAMGPTGKGMGGTHDHLPEIPLCTEHHIGDTGVHAQAFRLHQDNGLVYGYAGEVQLFVRAISLDDASEDPRAWTDERLAQEWDMAEERTRQNMGVMALVAFTLWERYGWADQRRDGFAWYERAADIIAQHTGRQVHWRNVYRLVDTYRAFREQAGEVIDEVGPRLALAAARADEPDEALQYARMGRDNGHTVVDIERGMGELCTVQASEPCSVHCDDCDTDVKHRRRL